MSVGEGGDNESYRAAKFESQGGNMVRFKPPTTVPGGRRDGWNASSAPRVELAGRKKDVGAGADVGPNDDVRTRMVSSAPISTRLMSSGSWEWRCGGGREEGDQKF